ncbi:acyl-CoA dehydrogenase family protein [Megasphaera vaginalis (ex Bordigoni et al. 2020)]|uniref:acyl-CoA dehydrogenase family protein n=1 Tax=Megasphaera vaginalis (ex Bordigoni et al. 2020) TaxID=2045301 RepID=UPI000C7A8793|nr:acyl-CoA dehydrogenase family protein [Megasphaera vaginalis (ex Bordigoni et al. 2020)]
MILTSEQQDIRHIAAEISEKILAPQAAYYDETEEFPWENIRQLSQAGFMGMLVPEIYGGSELNTVASMVALEEISKACAATGAIVAVHNAAGILPILNFGTDEQRKKYLPKLARGEMIGAFALTEPGAGSDAAKVMTTATNDGDEYILNGNKCFISNGGVAGTFVIFASKDKSKGVKGLSAFIVEKGTPGFSIGKHEKKMGIRASSTVELVFDNCRIPKGNQLGKDGEGFKIAMATLDTARIGIAAQAVGIAEAAYEMAKDYSKVREQFGKPICANQVIAFTLADMAIQIEAARQLTYHAAALKDSGQSYGKEAAMAKTFASDRAVQIALDAIQIMGGYGYSREYSAERLLRDAKITQIYEGTNQIQRLVISRQILK